MNIPELDMYSGSWIVVERTTGIPVLETYNKTIAMAVNQERYEVLTAYQYLTKFNQFLLDNKGK